eukprot:4194663-Prymnesium_polylepis.3
MSWRRLCVSAEKTCERVDGLSELRSRGKKPTGLRGHGLVTNKLLLERRRRRKAARHLDCPAARAHGIHDEKQTMLASDARRPQESTWHRPAMSSNQINDSECETG